MAIVHVDVLLGEVDTGDLAGDLAHLHALADRRVCVSVCNQSR